MDKWSIFLIFLVRKRRSSEHKMAGFCLGSQAYRGVKPLQIAFHTQCASFVPRRRFDVVITGDQIWNYLLKSDAKPSRTHIMSLSLTSRSGRVGTQRTRCSTVCFARRVTYILPVRPMSSESILLWHGGANGFVWPDDSNMPCRKAS